MAATKIPPAHYGYLMTGVLDDRTVASNASAYDRWGLRARRLVDVSKVDLSVSLFGQTWASPVALCPLSAQRAFHPEGELASARAAKARGALQMLSTVSSTGIEDVIAARGGPVWFQVYPTDDIEVAKALVRRAEKAGAGAIVLTLDLLGGGMRRETMARLARVDTRPLRGLPRHARRARHPEHAPADVPGPGHEPRALVRGPGLHLGLRLAHPRDHEEAGAGEGDHDGGGRADRAQARLRRDHRLQPWRPRRRRAWSARSTCCRRS